MLQGINCINHRLLKIRSCSCRRNSGVEGAELVSGECEINGPNIERQSHTFEVAVKNAGIANRMFYLFNRLNPDVKETGLECGCGWQCEVAAALEMAGPATTAQVEFLNNFPR